MGDTKKIEVEIKGVAVELHYCDKGNVSYHLENILKGADYPVLELEGFSPDFIVDIGAHVGATTLFLNAHYPKAKVFCFEPGVENFSYLERNIKKNSSVRAYNYGLGDEASDGQLYVGGFQSMQNSLIPSPANPEVSDKTESVEIRKASQVLSQLEDQMSGVGILKIDTEGYEVPILRSISEFLYRFDVIYFEYHSEEDRREIDSILKAGFSLWKGKSYLVHRGAYAYLSNRLIEQNPELSTYKIEHK